MIRNIFLVTLAISASVAYDNRMSSSYSNENVNIKTLPPEVSDRTNLHVADALLSDWEGKHWASLDADQDKVALSWTTDKDFITFQVGYDLN